ncbi:MAG: discoidin domain-containing protein, partial [Planctomycetaceae bacterium]|nr:discoidin domain-containing protein [Planctomycetaceae bacterium]
VSTRKTLTPVFDNEGMRPAVGNEFLLSRHLPDDMQGQFIYACVINMHGMPRFEVGDEPGTAGFAGKRIEDLLSSTDNFFRPVDPQFGPDGALWFGDWCNALIGHMQYSQRDPNRDHVHGRIYRLVYPQKELLKPELQFEKSIPELLNQLAAYELRTRYRARRELRRRDEAEVLQAVKAWLPADASPELLCEAMWIQEGFRKVDPALIEKLLSCDDFHARAAAVHTVCNESLRYPDVMAVYRRAIADEHPRVRLESLRGLSWVQTPEAAEVALTVIEKPLDYWIEYTLEHTLHALKPVVDPVEQQGQFLVNGSERARNYYRDYKFASGPGGKAVQPLKEAEDVDLPVAKRNAAIKTLAGVRGGVAKQGVVVFDRVCSGCHQVQDRGKAFGPKLDGIGSRYDRENLIRHILLPNEKIAKGFETVQLVTVDGEIFTGFILNETPTELTLGVATQDGKGKQEVIKKEDIELRKDLKASSMPEGLIKTIAPSEFLDLLEYLSEQTAFQISADGWITTAFADVGEIRTHGPWQEISRDAELQLGENFPDNWRKDAHLLLSAVDPTTREFVFHSPNSNSKDPAVVIRLASPATIGHISIQNRRNPQFYARAEGLTVWVSENGTDWKKVWAAKAPAEQYEADLPEGTKGRFLKIGLDGTGIFHLNQVVVYGKRDS